MFFKELLANLKRRSRSDWSTHFREILTDLRIWLQENGEVAAIVGLVTGIIIVLFFKLFVFLAVFGGLTLYVVWLIADPHEDFDFPRSDTSDRFEEDPFTVEAGETSEISLVETSSDESSSSDISIADSARNESLLAESFESLPAENLIDESLLIAEANSEDEKV